MVTPMSETWLVVVAFHACIIYEITKGKQGTATFEMRDSLSAAYFHAAESGLGSTEYNSVIDCVRAFGGRQKG